MRKKLIVILFTLGCCFYGYRVSAHPQYLKDAKKLGYPAQNCTYCHVKATGGNPWNQRGLWLKAQKKERKAPAVDVSWLKNYQPETKADKDVDAEKERK